MTKSGFEVLVSVLSASWRIEFFRGLSQKQIVEG
jgi:hypothetical protein